MNAPTPRVALISSSYAPYTGGVEEHVRHVARQFAARGIPVQVWTVDRGEHLGDRDVDGILVRYLPTPLPARTIPALARYATRHPAARRQWRQAHRDFHPDVLHVQCFGPNGIYARALHRHTGTPLIVSSHGETRGDDNAAYTRSQLLRTELTAAIRDAAAVTAPSTFVRDDLRDRFGADAVSIVPNGVDLSLQPHPPAAGIDSGDPYLAVVGRLGRMKGVDLLIDAYAASGLARTHRLLIGGDGPEEERLRAQADAAGIGGRVAFLGRLDPQQVADLMAGARAVVVPSRSEAFGIVALEAWRSSAALVMTSRGGAADFVHDGTDGLLVDPEDTAALADALRRIATDDPLHDRLAAAGATRVTEFSWDRVADAYLDVYAAASLQGHTR